MIRKLILFIVLAVTIFNMTVYANSFDNVRAAADSSGRVFITGKINHVRAGSIDFYITKKETDKNTLSDDNLSEKLIYLGRFVTDDSGNINHDFKFPESADTGEYTAWLSLVGGNTAHCDFVFANPVDSANALAKINAAEKSSLISVITQNKANILVDYTYFDRADFNKTAFIDFVFLEKPQGGFGNMAAFVLAMNRAVAVTALNNPALTLSDSQSILNTYGAELGVNMTEYASLTAGVRSALNKTILNEEYLNSADFINKYPIALMNARVANSENKWSDLKKLLTIDYLAEYGLPLSGDYNKLNNKDAVFQKMTGSDLSTIQLVRDAFNNAVTAQRQSEGGGGTGGTTTPGRSGGGSIFSADKPADTKSLIAAEKENAVVGFSDLQNALWAEEAINSLAADGVISGDGNGLFRPDDFVTRAEFAKIAAIAFNLGEKYTDMALLDVNYSDWYHPYVISLYKKGIVKGITNELFGSNEGLTKQDMVVILDRIEAYMGFSLTEDYEAVAYKDYNSISDYAVSSVSAFSKAGILKGDDTRMLLPEKNTTRAEVCKVVYGLIRYNEFVALKEQIE